LQLIPSEVSRAEAIETSPSDASRRDEAVTFEAAQGHLHSGQRTVEEAGQFSRVALIEQTKSEQCARARSAAKGAGHDHYHRSCDH